jgi:RsiW-degrading membrane proteinase PrsW (M82 family)
MLLLSVLLGLVPGFAWLIFYLSEDPHPEPKRLIVYTFIVGIVSGFFTIIIEELFNAATAAVGIPSLAALTQIIQTSAGGAAAATGIDATTILQLLFLLLGLAAIEELMKFSAAYFAVGKSPELDEPIDAMIYMIVAALGFATLENIGAITNVAAAAASGQGAIFVNIFETVSLRFVGATLLHSLTSAIVGYHWALGIMHKKVPHYLASGLIFATILHACFNYLILNYAPIGYSVLFLLVIGFFVLNDFEKLKVAPA